MGRPDSRRDESGHEVNLLCMRAAAINHRYRSSTVFDAVDGSCKYFLGMIDILTEYDTKKKAERLLKAIR